jgi:ParB family transcriptional regulator, chromosome partitioning protein
VKRLAIEKLEAKAEELRPQWAWTKAVLDPEYGFLAQYARVKPKPGNLPAELAEELQRIERRLAAIEEETNDEADWNEELASEAAKLEERRIDIEQIAEGLAVYSKTDRKRAGCIVTIGDSGEFQLHQGLVDRAATPRDADDSETAEDNDSWMSAEGDDDASQPSSTRPSPEQALRKECGFSQSLVDDLKAHRLQITRAHLAADFGVAFDLALYSLCVEIFDGFRYHARPLDLRATETVPRSSLNDLSGTPSDRLLEAHRSTLDLDWFNLPAAEGFAALAALPVEAKQRLFAWCIAFCLKPQLAIEDRADAVIESAGRRLAIPFADLWRPTAANYWGRVKKAHSIAIGREILGERWARDHADDKKPVLAMALEAAFDPQKSNACIALDQAARDTAATWLPPGMPFADADSADNVDTEQAGDVDPAAEDIDSASDELPVFLTEEGLAALNGAGAH